MASFLYGKHMSARNVGIPVIRPGLVFRIAVPFTRITLHYIADFYNGELRVVKFKLGKIGGKRFYFVCFHEFAQNPTPGNTAALLLFIVGVSVCIKSDCTAFLDGTQQSDAGGCIHIGNADGLERTRIDYLFQQGHGIHIRTLIDKYLCYLGYAAECQSAGIGKVGQVVQHEFRYCFRKRQFVYWRCFGKCDGRKSRVVSIYGCQTRTLRCIDGLHFRVAHIENAQERHISQIKVGHITCVAGRHCPVTMRFSAHIQFLQQRHLG